MAENGKHETPNITEDESVQSEEAGLDAEFDLLTHQTGEFRRRAAAQEQSAAENQQIEFIRFLRTLKSVEQKLALSDLYSDFELLFMFQQNVDYLDEGDPLGRPTVENSAKKTALLMDAVTRILGNILRIKPESPYIKETYKLRKSAQLPSEEYNRIKSPELDLVKAYTNFDQLKMLLANSLHNRQVFELLDSLYERVLPHFRDFLAGLGRGEEKSEISFGDEHEIEERVNDVQSLQADAESQLRSAVLSLTNSFLALQLPLQPGITGELIVNLKDIYRILNEFRKIPTDEAFETKAFQLQGFIEQSLLELSRVAALQPVRSAVEARSSFLYDLIEYISQTLAALDAFFERQSASRLDAAYFKRLELARSTIMHLRSTMIQERYVEKPQLPFLNLKSFVYFAVKVVRDLNYLNPHIHRKYRYYIERSIVDARLRQAFQKIPNENRVERRFSIPTLLELNRLLRIVSRVSPNKDDRTAYQLTYYWFKLVDRDMRNLIEFLKTYPAGDPLAARFDGISFTLEMEADRVFGKHGHLKALKEDSSIEEYIKHVEDSIGILSRVLQENYFYIARAYLPATDNEELDKDYKERLSAALLLREHTWCAWQVCMQAERQIRELMKREVLSDLSSFLNWLLRAVQVYLVKFLPRVFYSDRVELKRTYNDLLNCATLLAERKDSITAQHLEQLRGRVHLLGTLFASLSENIKNRSILEEKPFDQEAAERTLQKYLQIGVV